MLEDLGLPPGQLNPPETRVFLSHSGVVHGQKEQTKEHGERSSEVDASQRL